MPATTESLAPASTVGRRIVSWVLALTPFVLACLWDFPQGFGLTAGDYAHYLLHARALLEGSPYSETGYLFTALNPFIGPSVQPPGLPLTVAALFSVVGWNVLAARVLVFGFGLLFLVTAGMYFAKHESRRIGLGVAMLAALSPSMVHGSTQVLADLPFAALVWLAVLVTDGDGPWGWRRIVTVILIGLAAMSYRAAGVALVPAFALFALLHLRTLGWRPFIPVGVWAGLMILAFLGLLPGTSGLGQQVTNSTLTGLAFELKRVIAYRLPLFESMLYPFPSHLANDAYHILAAPVLVIGLGAWLRQSWTSFLACFAVVYAVMLLVIDVVAGRYAWPLYPLFVFCLLNGLRIIVFWGRRSWRGVRAESVVHAFAVVLTVLAVGGQIFGTQPRSRSGTLAEEGDVRAVFEELEQLDRTFNRELRVVFVKPRVLTLETRIPAMGLVTATPEATIEELCDKGITHVVLGGYGLEPERDASVRRALDTNPSRFDQIYSNASFSIRRIGGTCAN